MTYLSSSNNQPKSSTSFALGMLLGAVSVYFFSPRNGEENRKRWRNSLHALQNNYETNIHDRVQRIFGEVTDQGMQLYDKSRKAIDVSLRNMNQTMHGIDFSKYQILVDEVLNEVRDDRHYLRDRIDAFKEELLNEWNDAHPSISKNKKEIGASKKRLLKRSNGTSGE